MRPKLSLIKSLNYIFKCIKFEMLMSDILLQKLDGVHLMEQNEISNYRETQIKTATKGRLVVLLYDGLIKYLDIAIENIPKKNYDVVNNNILRAHDIIDELSMSLNMDAGKISERLLSIYTFLNKKLTEGNVKKDVNSLKFVRKMSLQLRDGWNEIAKKSMILDIREMDKAGGVDVAG